MDFSLEEKPTFEVTHVTNDSVVIPEYNLNVC